MTNREELVERRKYRRFEIPTGMFVSCRPHGPKLGEVIDISKGGLAFRYGSGEEPSGGSKELGNKMKIFLEEGSFHLNDVPFRPVADFGTYEEAPFPSVTMRRSSVQFNSLTHHQISQLENFIENCALGEV
jgi:hypothetical protein